MTCLKDDNLVGPGMAEGLKQIMKVHTGYLKCCQSYIIVMSPITVTALSLAVTEPSGLNKNHKLVDRQF